MTGLFAADAVTMLQHVFIYILVANGSFGVRNADLIQCLVETEIGHDRGHHGVVHQFIPFFHIATVDVDDLVAVDQRTCLIHGQTAVGIAIKGKAHVHAVFCHIFLKPLDVGGTGVFVDVEAVGLVVNHMYIRAQRTEHTGGNAPCAAVGAVQSHLHILEGMDCQRN